MISAGNDGVEEWRVESYRDGAAVDVDKHGSGRAGTGRIRRAKFFDVGFLC